MRLLVLLLTAYTFSPQDSCRMLVTLAEVPERALLFAELAASESGRHMLDLGRLLEAAGRFRDASVYYSRLAVPGSDPDLLRWLADRASGSLPLDTCIVFDTWITNHGPDMATDLEVILPMPVSHGPYQEITVRGSDFTPEAGRLVLRVDTLQPGDSRQASIHLHIIQEPFTFRPIPDPLGDTRLGSVADLMAAIPVPETYQGSGPCFDMSRTLRERAGEELGLELGIVGGLVRRGDSLVFHAWNLMEDHVPGLPLDPLFFGIDSLFAVGHCPTDVIPLWDLLSTDGSEMVVMFSSQDADLEIGMTASYAP